MNKRIGIVAVSIFLNVFAQQTAEQQALRSSDNQWLRDFAQYRGTLSADEKTRLKNIVNSLIQNDYFNADAYEALRFSETSPAIQDLMDTIKLGIEAIETNGRSPGTLLKPETVQFLQRIMGDLNATKAHREPPPVIAPRLPSQPPVPK